MDFANEYEIDTWRLRFDDEPTLLCGVLTLRSLVDGVNSCSDGWPYWAAPCRAAQKLIGMLREAERSYWRRGEDVTVTEADLKAAYRPIKAFVTRYGARYGFTVDLYFPVAEPATPTAEPLTLFA